MEKENQDCGPFLCFCFSVGFSVCSSPCTRPLSAGGSVDGVTLRIPRLHLYLAI